MKMSKKIIVGWLLVIVLGFATHACTMDPGAGQKSGAADETNVVSVLQEKSSSLNTKISTANTDIQKEGGFKKLTSSVAMGQGGFQPYLAPSASKMTTSSIRRVFATSTTFDANKGKVFKLTATKSAANALLETAKSSYPETGSDFFRDVTSTQSSLVDAAAITIILPANYFTEISKYADSHSMTTSSPEYSYITSSAYAEKYTDSIIVVLRKLMYLDRDASSGDVKDAKSMVKEKDDSHTDSEEDPLLLFDADLKNSDKTLLVSIQSMLIYRKIESTDKTFAKSIVHVISMGDYKLILSSSDELQNLLESVNPSSVVGSEYTSSDITNVYKLKSGSSHTMDHPTYDSIFTSETFLKTKVLQGLLKTQTVRLETRFGGSDVVIKGNIVNQLKADDSEISQDLKLELDVKKSDGKRSKSVVNRMAKAHDSTGDFDFKDETDGTTKKLSQYLDMQKVAELTATVKKLSGAISLKVHFEKLANYLIP